MKQSELAEMAPGFYLAKFVFGGKECVEPIEVFHHPGEDHTDIMILGTDEGISADKLIEVIRKIDV